jgi:hypothetical protein
MSKTRYRVLSAGYTQVTPRVGDQPASTQIRTHGEVFDMEPDDRAKAAVDAGHLEVVSGDTSDLEPLPALTGFAAPNTPVRLATGQGPVMTVADFRGDNRSLEQANASGPLAPAELVADAPQGDDGDDGGTPGSIDPDAIEKPSGNAGHAEWAAYAVTQGMSAEEADGLSRNQLRDRFADK